MKPPSEFELCTGDEPVEAWLARWDNRPHVLPRWPQKRMTLVACMTEDMDSHAEDDARAFVMVQPDQAASLCDFGQGLDTTGVLFFVVPRQTLIDSGLVSGLSAESWD